MFYFIGDEVVGVFFYGIKKIINRKSVFLSSFNTPKWTDFASERKTEPCLEEYTLVAGLNRLHNLPSLAFGQRVVLLKK